MKRKSDVVIAMAQCEQPSGCNVNKTFTTKFVINADYTESHLTSDIYPPLRYVISFHGTKICKH